MCDKLRIRPVLNTDAPALAALLNEVIARGGTTALEQPFTPAALDKAMLTGPDVYCCFVAEGTRGGLVGFQALTRSDHVPDGVGEIGTFARVQHVQKGTGSLLFAATQEAARKRGLTAINATIRADNLGGLAFYGRLGFIDNEVHHAVPLSDGTPVDRISKRFTLQGAEEVC